MVICLLQFTSRYSGEFLIAWFENWDIFTLFICTKLEQSKIKTTSLANIKDTHIFFTNFIVTVWLWVYLWEYKFQVLYLKREKKRKKKKKICNFHWLDFSKLSFPQHSIWWKLKITKISDFKNLCIQGI